MADLYKIKLFSIGRNEFFKPQHYSDPLNRPLTHFINMNIKI